MTTRQRLLLFFLLSLLASTGYLVFVHMITNQDSVKNEPPPEEAEESLARIYENFLHKTKYSYDTILDSGTDYTNQERVFIDLTKKLKALDKAQGPDYQGIRNQLLEEIEKNKDVFESFYIKATKTTPQELQKIIDKRNQQYDIIYEED